MSRGGDPQDVYGDQYNEPDGYNEAYENEREGRSGSLFPYSVSWGGWSSFFGRGKARDGGSVDGYRDRTADATPSETTYDGNAGGGTDESKLGEGLAGLLLVAGVVLFLFPEPATSLLGIVLVTLGVVAWAAEALS